MSNNFMKYEILPLRQKRLLGLTCIVGFVILILHILEIINPQVLEIITIFYLLGVPFSLLTSEELIDLNDNRIFNIWLIIGIIYFCIYLIIRNMNYNWIGTLRALPSFLVAYKVFNTIIKKITGRCLLNTYRQISWSHDTEKLQITALDVVFNLLLCFIIAISALFELIFNI